MVDLNIYGWTYTEFNSFVGWYNAAAQLQYEAWENHWSRKIDSYIFTGDAASPRLSGANEKAEVGDIVNELMTQMNLYLKAGSTESPLETGLYDNIGFPVFHGDPEANEGKGTGHYAILNKYRRKYSQSEARVDSIRIGANPDDNPFGVDKLFY